MLHRLPILFAVLCMWTSDSLLRADLVVFGSDSSNSTELADLVNKNADVRSAIAAFEKGDLAECERMFSQALKSDKNLPSVDVMIARLLMQKGQLNEALSRLESYISKGIQQDAEAYATMGEIALMSGRFTDAWLQFREASTIVKTTSTLSKSRKEAFNTQLLQRKAETAMRRQDIATAQILYKELEAALPDSGFPLMAQARILISNSDITRGAELLRRAKKLDKTIPQPELQIALALSTGKDNSETEKWFRDGIRQSDASVANWFEYLKWLLKQDRPEDVQFLIQKAPESFRSDRLLRFLDAMSLRFLGKVEEAEKAFSILLSENTADMESADQLALILVESVDQGKKIRAQQLSQNNLRRAQNEENVIATAGWIEFKLGATDVADQYFNSLIARGTSNPQTIYYVARILEIRGRTEDAMALYQNAVDIPGLFVQRTEVKEKLAEKAKGSSSKKDEKPAASKSKTDGNVTPPQPLTPPSNKPDATPPAEKSKKPGDVSPPEKTKKSPG